MKKIILFIFSILFTQHAFTQNIRYVKQGGTGDGLSWATASGDIQVMMNQLRGTEGQVWVAAGVYKPIYQYNNGNHNPTNRYASFFLRDSIKLIGGFPNTGSPTINDTSLQNNKTILSGDLDNNDTLNADGTSNVPSGLNAYHVVVCSKQIGPIAPTLAGFYITGGVTHTLSVSTNVNNTIVTPGYGGGITVIASSPTIKNCLFTGNTASLSSSGGAIYIGPARLPGSPTRYHSVPPIKPIIENCKIINNTGGYGAGIYIGGASTVYLLDSTHKFEIVIKNTEISANTSSYAGGGIYFGGDSVSANISNCFISGNVDEYFGGGIHFASGFYYGGCNLYNTLITGNVCNNFNSHPGSAGGISNFSFLNSPVNIVNCTVAGNRCLNNGSGGISTESIVNVYNSVVYNNQPKDYAKSPNHNSINILTNNIIGIYSDHGANNIVTNMLTTDPQFVNPVSPTLAPTSAGNYRLSPFSPGLNYGNNSFISGFATDLDNNNRIFGANVDLGAYELQQAAIQPMSYSVSSHTQSSCIGVSSAFLELSVSNGTAPYSYEWIKTGSPGIYSTSFKIENLAAGTYTCTIKDAVGINQQTIIAGPYTITEPPAITATTSSISNCTGSVFSSSVTVNASGGTGPLTYNWLPVGGSSQTATNLPVGNYTCTITDSLGCTLQVPVVVSGILPDANGIVFVKKGGTGNGNSWANAMGDLSDALNFIPCATSNIKQIWLASGTYQPVAGSSFTLLPGIDIIGGFKGTETELLTATQLQINRADGDTTILMGNGSAVVRINTFAQTDSLFGCKITGGIGVGTAPNGNGGGIYINGGGNSNPTISNCIIENNTAMGTSNGLGGGIYVNGRIFLYNSIIKNNTANFDGGGLYLPFYTGSRVVNCIFQHNSANRNGGAIDGSGLSVINSTIVNNTALTNGSGIDGSSTLSIANSIIRNNTGSQISGSATASYSNIEAGFTGTGNIDANPLFYNLANGDVRLQTGSPSINTGNNTLVPANISTDIIGNIRIVDAVVDMGAFENMPCGGYIVVYVDSAATGANNGSSWADAYVSMTDAINTLNNCVPTVRINIAKGTYPFGPSATYNFNKLNAQVLGGYPGGGGVRNPVANPVFFKADVLVLKSMQIDGVIVEAP